MANERPLKLPPTPERTERFGEGGWQKPVAPPTQETKPPGPPPKKDK
jgi:hypothetical protein